MFGDSGDDTMFGASFTDFVNQATNDAGNFLSGGSGNDKLYGGGGAGGDVLFGGPGHDFLYGGYGVFMTDMGEMHGEDGDDEL